ncbi:MAG: hypothetical protein AAF657_00755 [Acidobacteriota bacterium]
MSPNIFTERTIEVEGVRSLVWDGDCLVDWVDGGHRYGIDGSIVERSVRYAYTFDASVTSPSGDYAVIYTSTGTTGLLLRNGEVVRQINREFYHANAYLYPIAFAQLPDGREVLIHCPEAYCQIDIEDAETGECLTKREPPRDIPDIFHSRLSVSPNGRWLMSAGWVWHPLDVVHVYDLLEALRDPRTLDTLGNQPPGMWELQSASFAEGNTVIVGASDEYYGDDEDPDDDQPGENRIALWEIGASTYSARVALGHPPGTIMAINQRFIVSMFEQPRLIDLNKGQTLHEWSDIDSGKQTSSITWDKLPPPMALDSQNARFAVAQESNIRIIQINLEAIGD